MRHDLCTGKRRGKQRGHVVQQHLIHCRARRKSLHPQRVVNLHLCASDSAIRVDPQLPQLAMRRQHLHADGKLRARIVGESGRIIAKDSHHAQLNVPHN
jgi:hypothetical protein